MEVLSSHKEGILNYCDGGPHGVEMTMGLPVGLSVGLLIGKDNLGDLTVPERPTQRPALPSPRQVVGTSLQESVSLTVKDVLPLKDDVNEKVKESEVILAVGDCEENEIIDAGASADEVEEGEGIVRSPNDEREGAVMESNGEDSCSDGGYESIIKNMLNDIGEDEMKRKASGGDACDQIKTEDDITRCEQFQSKPELPSEAVVEQIAIPDCPDNFVHKVSDVTSESADNPTDLKYDISQQKPDAGAAITSPTNKSKKHELTDHQQDLKSPRIITKSASPTKEKSPLHSPKGRPAAPGGGVNRRGSSERLKTTSTKHPSPRDKWKQVTTPDAAKKKLKHTTSATSPPKAKSNRGGPTTSSLEDKSNKIHSIRTPPSTPSTPQCEESQENLSSSGDPEIPEGKLDIHTLHKSGTPQYESNHILKAKRTQLQLQMEQIEAKLQNNMEQRNLLSTLSAHMKEASGEALELKRNNQGVPFVNAVKELVKRKHEGFQQHIESLKVLRRCRIIIIS